jgi:Ca-activated chloride channel homolog
MTHLIRFMYPGYLLLLPALILLPIWFYLKKRNRLTKLSLALRLSIIVLLVLALSGLQVARGKRNTALVFVVDRSESVAPIDKSGAMESINRIVSCLTPEDEAGVVVFGKEAVIEQRLQKNLRISEIQSTPAATGTNISRGLALARSMLALRPDASKRIVLLSDGNQTAGNAAKDAAIFAMEGISIDVLPLATAAESSGRKLFLKSTGPESVRLDEPFELEISLRGEKDRDAGLQIFRDGVLMAKQRHKLSADLEVLKIAEFISKPGFHQYRIRLEDEDKNRSYDMDEDGFVVYAYGRTRVLHLTEKSDGFLDLILKKQGFEIVRSDPRAGPKTIQDFSPYDVVILDNAPASDFSQEQMGALIEHVAKYAGGLVMIGGSGSFGPGGYSSTPVEKALPVEMALRNREKKPALALVLILDKSGSMGMEQRKISKLDMAKEAVLRLCDLLNPGDALGIIAFDRSPREVMPLGRGVDRATVNSSLRAIVAGGGTSILPAVDMAYRWLDSSAAEKKHILLLSDGQADQAERKPLAERVAGSSVVFSTVGIGSDVDRALMKKLADSARGRAYFTDTGMDLPEIFKREALLISGQWLIERPFVPHRSSEHEILQNVGKDGFPAMTGYIVTTPKKLSEILLTADNEDPILACGRYGLGKTLVFMSDLSSSWTQRLVRWKHFPGLWAQMIRWAARGGQSDVLHVRVKMEEESALLAVDAFDASGEFINNLNVGARLESPDSTGSDIAMAQTASGQYEGRFPLKGKGIYLFTVSAKGHEPEAGSTLHFGIDFSKLPEDRCQTPDMPLIVKLATAAGGQIMSNGQESLSKNLDSVYIDAWQPTAICAMLFFMLDLIWNMQRKQKTVLRTNR